MMGVSRKSVGRWLAGEMQSCNVNAEKLLNLAIIYMPEVVRRVLLEDLERHRLGIKDYMGNMGVRLNLREDIVIDSF